MQALEPNELRALFGRATARKSTIIRWLRTQLHMTRLTIRGNGWPLVTKDVIEAQLLSAETSAAAKPGVRKVR